jgi:hypothetical protein
MKTGWRVKKSHEKLRLKNGVGQYMKDVDGKLIPVAQIKSTEIIEEDGIYTLAIFLNSGRKHDIAYGNDFDMMLEQKEMTEKEIAGHRFWLEEEE